MAEPLTLDNIEIKSGSDVLLRVDARIAPGAVLSVMGPSGAGKSTLLAFLTGTLPRDFSASGRVLIGARDITDLPTHKRRIGILFQADLLFPHMSVGQNLAFGLAPGPNRAARIAEALAEIDLAGFETRDPATLSGGQKARVALMRMLLSEPCALLLDEPFSGLDPSLRRQIRALVFDRAKARGLPVVLVTHDEDDARAAGGAVLQIGG